MQRSASTASAASRGGGGGKSADNKSMKDAVAALPYQDLLDRQETIQERLQVIAVVPIKAKKPTAANSNTHPKSPASSRSRSAKRKKTVKDDTEEQQPPPNDNQVPLLEKTTDVHWDFTMKEMMWLATDFQGERKRQMSLAKKIAAAVRQYHKTRETRRLRELAEAELKRRRLAGRIGREVRGWWTKIERVIAYKQKCSADEERRKAMNKQLVTLVKQTEKYTESLIHLPDQEEEEDEDYSSSDSKDESPPNGTKNHRKRQHKKIRKRHTMSIEEALAVGERSRRSKNKVVDYNQLQLQAGDATLYGESTASDTGSDNSYSPDDSDHWTDDETTLLEAEALETRERLQELGKQDGETGNKTSFTADPRELRVLQEERDMSIEQVLERYRAEADAQDTVGNVTDEATAANHLASQSTEPASETKIPPRDITQDGVDSEVVPMEVDETTAGPRNEATAENTTKDAKENHNDAATMPESQDNEPGKKQSTRRVSFAPSPTRTNGRTSTAEQQSARASPSSNEAAAKYDADDDGDASDVEDFVDLLEAKGSNGLNGDDDDASEEFEADENEVDDETTLIQEEKLPQEMSAEQEIVLLKAENEMSVEELRKLYAGVLEGPSPVAGPDETTTEDEPSRVTNAESAKDSNAATDESAAVGKQSEPDEQRKAATLAGDDDDDDDASDDAKSNGDNSNDGSEEFQADPNVVDDETTLTQEEALPREMSAEEELDLLKSENEMSIEELRQRYAAVLAGPVDDNSTAGPEAENQESSEIVEQEDGEKENSDNQQASEVGDVQGVRRSKRRRVGDSASTSALLTRTANDNQEGASDGEFEPQGDPAPDDETTIEAEERLGRDMPYEAEIALLNEENEMSVEELKAKYLGVLSGESNGSDNGATGTERHQETTAMSSLLADEVGENTSRDAEEDGEFVADGEVVDDETTMEAEERLGREMSPEEELAVLQKDSETPIESLYEMYQKMEEERLDADGSDDPSCDVNSSKKRKRDPDNVESEQDPSNSKRPKEEESSADEGLAAIQALEASAERARQTLASRPFLLASWVKLRKYQQTGLNWLVSLQTRRLNGILADEMGLGKTLQTISLLAYLASYKGIWGPHLVIVPTSVIVNWETELKRFCPGLKSLCYYGSAKRRKELRSGWTKTNWYHVVITSYQLAVQDAFAFKRKRWYYLILDEAQNIKNFQSQRWQTLINFNTQRRLLLTGTPLQNNLMELWSLLHFLMPYIFRSRKEFSFWFSNPMNSMIDGTGNQNDEMVARLHGIIRPFVLRRLKKDVEKQLPGKYEHIVKCPLSRRQMFFYEEFMARSSTRQAMKKGGNYMGMMNVLMQLRKVCNHPDLFEPRSVVTPFVVKSISISVPSCLVGINSSRGVFERLSLQLMSPLWCGSGAMPSLPTCREHDQFRSTALMELEDRSMESPVAETQSEEDNEVPMDIPRALADLLDELKAEARSRTKDRIAFQQKVNSSRCRSPPFPLTTRLQKAVHVRPHPIYELEEDLLSTPSQLLAMRRNQQERADDVDEMVKNFVCCVPKAGAPRPTLEIRTSNNDTMTLEEVLMEPIEDYLQPFRKAHARLTSFFPDKKLVQFDAGKLQTLAELLHDLKRGSHRVLIFTQMSKMLDILEAFLNLNGHTYVRLDGSTGVDRRQRLMDRFNNDPKIFSFILSTRSGGMGINLTGADTVIFYDSDWNPAMDAQAQDRAHRIGQTRDVHIYRLITEHSIEENILVKAQQKRNLDIIVMDKGKFDGSARDSKKEEPIPSSAEQDQSDVFTKGGLRAILGVGDDDFDNLDDDDGENEVTENLTKEQMEAAMTNLEDKDDVLALRGAQKEAAEDLREFDETVELQKDSDNEGDDEEAENNNNNKSSKGQPKDKKPDEDAPDEKNQEEEMVKEFAAWQDDVGLDTSALVASLSPTEKYGYSFRQEIDPFYSVFAIMEERRRLEAAEETKEELDIDQIEMDKADEERRAIEDGDLLATRPKPEELVRQRNFYNREKARLKSDKKRRTLTGENWDVREDGRTNAPFWYNTDTGEALWDRPTVLLELEAEADARRMLWSGLQRKPLVQIMSFLLPYPDRIQCTKVCRQWRLAASDISFVRHIYPVEMGAIMRDDKHMAPNHYRSIADALSIALPGDTIEFSDGHYWVSQPGLSIDFPLKLVGDENNASNVVIEMSGTVDWRGKSGWVEGVTFRRPKISSGEGSTDDMLRIAKGGRVDIVQSVIDNSGSSGTSAVAIQGPGVKCRWEGVIIHGGKEQGVKLSAGATLELEKCVIRGSAGNGITADSSEIKATESSFVVNDGFGAEIRGGNLTLHQCKFDRNAKGTVKNHQEQAG
ncbi:PHOTOPERIOD-INDEPENDENT EARLY FLOWERING 1 [Seminavis robusta]|uniref:PHOTOPERIOD-INDEPENDENT EARLY FLOWERING 1 n=1 Tax=Seminavis robusta TaxID=568900 RepID=A0A9N8ECK8_9STRA|nr:PHOTOPERIOD-INDEPENDENT EARLY FLOWERING 1 [Seminavis robusta]|eukprot:Sro757_g197940.1 PHOTOPERIOD-INDEPENDENT EARLY FLOWERING 1 (2331) ;mRNA; r:18684-26241